MYEENSEPAEDMKNCDRILLEYFKNNRYPKKPEKIKLAMKANVSLQYVVNFFYNARSRAKKAERERLENCLESTLEEYGTTKCTHMSLNLDESTRNSRMCRKLCGNRNYLYLRSPILRPELHKFINDPWIRGNRNEPSFNQGTSGLDQNDFYY